ncbi:hypothetical protein M885DRAFT_613559 [Pelagophyceae sp. CCMP2097]|nr:hypothetical protein M885DRAFT_613559 [Pelagophyceae sp. CCMP2097]
MRVLLRVAVLLRCCCGVELNLANFDDSVAGFAVLIKFGEGSGRNALRPAWDALEAKFLFDGKRLIANVDCDGAGKSLCERHSISKYPTLLSGSDPWELEVYKGARDLRSLTEYVQSGLTLDCSTKSVYLCSALQQDVIAGLGALSTDEMRRRVENLDAEKLYAEEAFLASKALLNDQYDAFKDARDAASAALQSRKALLATLLA